MMTVLQQIQWARCLRLVALTLAAGTLGFVLGVGFTITNAAGAGKAIKEIGRRLVSASRPGRITNILASGEVGCTLYVAGASE